MSNGPFSLLEDSARRKLQLWLIQTVRLILYLTLLGRKDIACELSLSTIFLRSISKGGGLLKIWGIRYFFLDQKGDQKIFSNKKGGSLIFFKE